MVKYVPAVVTLESDPDSPGAVEFFRFVGLCVCAWAFVDRHLYQIFHHAVGFEQHQSAFVYYRNRAFNNRLRMVDDALKMFLPTEMLQAEWKPLHKQVDDLSHVRNIFAHHPPLRSTTVKDDKPIENF